jgi:hypothetical protein
MYIHAYAGLEQAAPVSPAAQASGSSLFQKLQEALASGQWYLALTF